MGYLWNFNSKKLSQKLGAWLEKRAKAIWTNLLTNHLWQRMLKNTLATTIAVVLALIPAVVAVYGKAAYLGAITTVFGHPGRRFGMMAEALVLAVSGTLLGIGWSMFGLYLSSLMYDSSYPASYTIRGVFLVVALLFHGFFRSHAPRLFILVLLLVIVAVVGLTSTENVVSKAMVTQLLYPILTATGILLVVNVLVFPEFSSSFLGITTIETLGETVGALRDSGVYFVNITEQCQKNGEIKESDQRNRSKDPNQPPTTTNSTKEAQKDMPTKSLLRKAVLIFRRTKNKLPLESVSMTPKVVKLKSLTDSKGKLRAKLASCKAAQQECNFELAWAVLPPRDLKAISDTQMRKLVANTISLIGACESKYALMGDGDDKDKANIDDNDESKSDAEVTNAGVDKDISRPGTGDNTPDGSADEQNENKKERKGKSWKKKSKSKFKLQQDLADLELVKPKKEIASGDVELLRHLVSKIAKPLTDLQQKIDKTVDVITSCLAYCYDVPKLPSGALTPKGIELEEIDLWVDSMTEALASFDKDSAAALESAAALHDLNHSQIDIMPRMETFLISSFLLNLRQAALHTLEMLNHSRILVEKRQSRHGRSRLYAPRIKWRKWLVSGGEEDSLALPEGARKDVRTGNRTEDLQDDSRSATNKKLLSSKTDVESAPPKESQSPKISIDSNQSGKETSKVKEKTSLTNRLRNGIADILEYLAGSEDVLYAVKLTVAVFLVTWPAFVHKWNEWYALNRGLWAALQLVLVTEVAIGTSVMAFTLRAVGTTIGCIWGYAAYEARDGNRVVCVIILVIGIIPSTYIQLGSKYVKAGMVSIISMCIVVLATLDSTVPGTARENFLKRLIAFLIGGVVALIVEVTLFPVKARDRLVESLAASIRQLNEMEACLAYGIETETNIDVQSSNVYARFDIAKSKAEGALAAAETFLPFCTNEPRLKGSFKGLALIYEEILYVIHAIVDKMDNMLYLRKEFGSGVLEELNERVYPYRRNVAGSITLVLFAVHEALTTKLPLPQFLPSARLAHMRMVNRVREVVTAGDMNVHRANERSEIEMKMVKRVVRQKFLSWNAASAGQIEVIEYLEELIDLAKLLVGANEFRSGMLTRPTYKEYVDRIDRDALQLENLEESQNVQKENGEDESRDIILETGIEKKAIARRRNIFSRSEENAVAKESRQRENQEIEIQRQSNEEELPRSLQRVRSRRMEEIHLHESRSRDEYSRTQKGKRVDKSS